MAASSNYRCISCSQEYNIQDIRYLCECGKLLEVIHDLNCSIPNVSNWKKTLDDRLNKTSFERYQDILFPSLPSCGLPGTFLLVGCHGADLLPASRNLVVKAVIFFFSNLLKKQAFSKIALNNLIRHLTSIKEILFLFCAIK